MQWQRYEEEGGHLTTTNQQVDKEEDIVGDYNRIDDLYGDGRELSLKEVCKVASLQEYKTGYGRNTDVRLAMKEY